MKQPHEPWACGRCLKPPYEVGLATYYCPGCDITITFDTPVPDTKRRGR